MLASTPRALRSALLKGGGGAMPRASAKSSSAQVRPLFARAPARRGAVGGVCFHSCVEVRASKTKHFSPRALLCLSAGRAQAGQGADCAGQGQARAARGAAGELVVVAVARTGAGVPQAGVCCVSKHHRALNTHFCCCLLPNTAGGPHRVPALHRAARRDRPRLLPMRLRVRVGAIRER